MKKAIIVGVFFMICTASSIATTEDKLLPVPYYDTIHIEEGGYSFLRGFMQDKVTISVETDGKPVDILVMDQGDMGFYKKWIESGMRYSEVWEEIKPRPGRISIKTRPAYIEGISKLNVTNKTFSWSCQEFRYVFIDNTEYPNGGAYAGAPVTVRVKIEPRSTLPGFGAFFAIAGLLGVSYLLRRGK